MSSVDKQMDEMYVTKRSGEREIVAFDKILNRIKKLGLEAGIKLNYTSLVMKVIDQLYDGISTTKIDELSAEQCASLASTHPDYNSLAGRIVVSNHHKNTLPSFSQVMSNLYNYVDKHGKISPLISEELYNLVKTNGNELDTMCKYDRDYLIDFFGFKTLDRAYLMKINRITVERPQHMWLRVAIGIHGNNMTKITETYELMSQKYFTHATPTLFNAGTPHPQLSSCYLLAMENDSIDGIYNTLKDCALISKWAGGIGLHIHNIRASGSHIRGTNGQSNGIVPMLRVFNNTAKYVDQCVSPNTIIYTRDGPIPIEDCISGITQVINRNGLFETVQKVLEHPYSGTIHEITTVLNTNTLHITPEHPIYVFKNPHREQQYMSHSQILNELNSGLSKLEWVDAKDVIVGDYIVHSVPKIEIDYPELTENICYIYGLILSGLCITEHQNARMNLSVNPERRSWMHILHSPNKITELVQFFGENAIPYETRFMNYYNMIMWQRTTVLPFTKSDFVTDGKLKIGKRWLHLPLNKLNRIMDGLGNSDDVSELFVDMQYMQLRLGKLPSYCIAFEVNKWLVPVISNNETMYRGSVVYDLQMNDEHNYMLYGGVVHNGGGKRNGSFAIYLEPWHADIEHFLQMRKNHGDEELKARDLFYALWIPDLFMERVKTDGKWTLMCPDECPGLSDVYGDAFKELYENYENSGKGRKSVKARELWLQVLDAQMETGTPYLLYKDACNKKSNQKNVGTIKSSNLCTEIIEYSDDKETAVCNLASIALPAFVDVTQDPPVFNYEKLHEVSRLVTYNLNRIIDVNYYPTEKTRVSNMRHRPIGIGVQGLADVFMMMNMPFISDSAKEINRMIFETIYNAALTESCNISKIDGPYSTFQGSPASLGELQFDMWNVTPIPGRYNWDQLKLDIQKYGIRNSLLLAPMPTASTSQILGYNECIEPITSNIYSRRTIAGEFIMANRYLMNDLLRLNLWNEKVKNSIISNHGSIQHIDIIPQEIRDKYKTVWELPMRQLIDMAADRGAFICQSQSLNLWLEDPNYSTLTSMHFYSWSKGLKTGIYYLRRRGRHQAQQFTIEPEKGKVHEESEEICEMCSA